MSSGQLPAPIPVVIADASAVIDAVAGDERVLAYFEEVVVDSGLLLVPPHFWSELAKGLFHRRRDPLRTAIDLQGVAQIGLQVADRGVAGLIDAMSLASKHGLSVYDALYLQLALDVQGDLATRDRELAAAADAEGIIVRP